MSRTLDNKTDDVQYHIEVTNNDDLLIYGKLKRALAKHVQQVEYLAAAPVDRRTSFSGSGMPYADEEQAFYDSPNTGSANVEGDGSFAIRMKVPSSYYIGLGTVLVPPTVYIKYAQEDEIKTFKIIVDGPVAFRMLTYPMHPKRASPEFYSVNPKPLPRTQEQILRASGYPTDNVVPDNFWGTKPPV
jgi:hypothetical protein